MVQAATRNWARIVLIIALAVALVSIAYRVLQGSPASPPMADTAAGSPPASPGDRIQGLKQRVDANPGDAEGWQLLGFAYFSEGRNADAADAYRKATLLQPGNATFWSSLGEAVVMASDHDPMPAEALAAFRKAVGIDAKDPRARYFLAVKRDLDKDHKGAIEDWFALLADTPPGAPWEADLKRTISQVGKINKIAVEQRLAAMDKASPHAAFEAAPGSSVAAAGIPGPTREQMAAARALPPGQQQQMVDGMVASLEAKLAANPANVEGWIMLMRSRMTLGQGSQAAAAYKKAVAANPKQTGRIRDEARILSVPGV